MNFRKPVLPAPALLFACLFVAGTPPALAEQPADEALIIGIVDVGLFTPLFTVRSGQIIRFINAVWNAEAAKGVKGAPNPQMEGMTVTLVEGGEELKLGTPRISHDPYGPGERDILSYEVDSHRYGLAYRGEWHDDMKAQADPADYGKLLAYLLGGSFSKDDLNIRPSLYSLSLDVRAGILQVTDVDLDGDKEFWVTGISFYGKNTLSFVETREDGAAEIFGYCRACD